MEENIQSSVPGTENITAEGGSANAQEAVAAGAATEPTVSAAPVAAEPQPSKPRKEKNYSKAITVLLALILAIMLLSIVTLLSALGVGFWAIRNGKVDLGAVLFPNMQNLYSDPGDPGLYSDPGIDDPQISGETKEDDVVIGEEYVIRSTKHISGAYLSGDTSALTDKEKETLDMAKKVIDEVIKDGMTDYEKEKAIYDWMTANLGFDENALVVIPQTGGDSDNPYGVLKYHNAVCVGYATTFRLFMEMCEIPCMVVHDTYCCHSWDLTQLDGSWYHTDIYMDVNKGNYANFNMNEALALRNHNWDMEFFPKADSLKYNESFRRSVEFKDMDKLPAMIRKALEDQESSLNLTLSELGDNDYQMVNYIVNRICSNYEHTQEFGYIALEPAWCELDNGGYFLSLAISFYGGEQSFELDQEIRDKLDQKIEDSFGDLEVVNDPSYYDDYLYTGDDLLEYESVRSAG